MITPEMKAAADALLTWRGVADFGASDVLVWWRVPGKQIGVAFRGDAPRIQRSVLEYDRRMMPNRSYQRGGLGHLDESLQKALGVNEGQRLDTPNAYYAEVLSAVNTAVSARLGLEDWNVVSVLMPNEGSPWVPGSKQTEYYSAKKRKVFVTSAPSWALEGEYRGDNGQERGLIADVCTLSPVLEPERASGEAVVGRLKGIEFFSTHSLRLDRATREETIASIKRCGGLLYPSLAVGHLPASIFGPVSLFTDVRLPLLSVKPYKERGRYPIVLYGYDVWTETTSHFLGRFARDLFLQLTGNGDNDPRYLAVLGPVVGGGGGPVEESGEASPVVATTSKLATILARRAKVWNAQVTNVDAVRDAFWNKPERYPYLEAKVHVRLPLSVFRLATAPEPLGGQAQAFLRAVGYAGPLALVQLGSVRLEDIAVKDQATYEFSWAVRRAVLEYAAGNPRATVEIVT